MIGKTVTLYLGPNPPLGIVSVEGSQYGIPGRNKNILSLGNKCEASCFLEISLSSAHEVSSKQLDLLKKEDKNTQNELLSEARQDLENAERLLDAISGCLALQIHSQLVLKPLAENSF